jgi:Cu-Zn family superoxide dismutase
MRACLLLLLVLAGCGRSQGESLGKMGGAPPTLILNSGLIAANGAFLGEANLLEELQGDRLVLKLTGLPPGRHAVALHGTAKCGGAGFSDAGPPLSDTMPVLEIGDDGAGDYYADLPLPRLRDPVTPRLDADGMAVTTRMQGQPLACATFRLPPRKTGR